MKSQQIINAAVKRGDDAWKDHRGSANVIDYTRYCIEESHEALVDKTTTSLEVALAIGAFWDGHDEPEY